MRKIAIAAVAAAIAGPVLAQSNTVAGLDGRLTVVNNLTYWGRRGAAHPNGEAGMSMLNTMCNPGSVVIPWQAPMQPNHPMFGFIITRESNGRMVQISDWSYCKHAFLSINVNGACGTCQNPGTGSLMGLNCSDTYSAGNNGSRTYLGPPAEIDPWLGIWNPVGSYFDKGDPEVAAPNNADGARSTISTGGDAVKNRVTVKEQDLLVPGSFYYGIQLIHRGEAVANRGDNIASRGFNPVWNGSSWSFSNNSVGQSYGSILQNWSGASVNMATNGNDDGRVFVAAKVTQNGAMWHYEYAVHNVDMSRGIASFRVPVGLGATVSGFGFRDIDGDALNDWTGQQVGNEIVFTAPANNPQNWNQIYNVWFDCSVGPVSGSFLCDAARIGPGALTVPVAAQVPSSDPSAYNTIVGAGCGSPQGLALDAGSRPVLGTAVAMTTSNIPAGSTLSLLMFSADQASPPVDLGSIGMTGCLAYINNPESFNATFLPVGTAIDNVSLPNDPYFIGLGVGWQSLSFSPGANAAGILSSNGLITLLAAQ